jgi:hypothetical protein
MTSIDAINRIKVMLGLEKEKFEKTATLVDGTEVYVENEFEPGAQLSVITEDGLIPAPEGVHTLENGTEVTVDAAGIIVEVAEAAAEEGFEDVTVEVETENPVAAEIIEEIIEVAAEVLAPALEEAEIAEFKKKFKAGMKKTKLEEVVVATPASEEAADITEDVLQAVVEAIQPIVEEIAVISEEMKKMKGDFSAFSADSAAAPLTNGHVATKTDSRIETLKKFRKN